MLVSKIFNDEQYRLHLMDVNSAVLSIPWYLSTKPNTYFLRHRNINVIDLNVLSSQTDGRNLYCVLLPISYKITDLFEIFI